MFPCCFLFFLRCPESTDGAEFELPALLPQVLPGRVQSTEDNHRGAPDGTGRCGGDDARHGCPGATPSVFDAIAKPSRDSPGFWCKKNRKQATWTRCVAALPCMGSSGPQGLQHRANWMNVCSQTLHSIHDCLGGLFRHIDEVKVLSSSAWFFSVEWPTGSWYWDCTFKSLLSDWLWSSSDIIFGQWSCGCERAALSVHPFDCESE